MTSYTNNIYNFTIIQFYVEIELRRRFLLLHRFVNLFPREYVDSLLHRGANIFFYEDSGINTTY